MIRDIQDISIHAPTKGATIMGVDNISNAKEISIHAPTKGATYYTPNWVWYPIYFNPRTHEGCDDALAKEITKLKIISIHAPTKGATSFF